MNYSIDIIAPENDKQICEIIMQVGKEFGAIGEGFGPSDAEVQAMSRYYLDALSSRYFVAKIDGKIVGGGGVAAFNGNTEICELKKLFLAPEGRGFGFGKTITEQCLNYARTKGYKKCYLDTLSSMKAAICLYEKMGFSRLAKPIDGTIHSGCDVWMIKEL
ncbi:MAG: GNAT family N-acetyltransferase [Leptolyngbyaceae cyanobacterium MO_188.B28]|nr:GNAT family N-acetyltransferase [Leptolyngbyaceae cyanobacterium MO_188.B28]